VYLDWGAGLYCMVFGFFGVLFCFLFFFFGGVILVFIVFVFGDLRGRGWGGDWFF